jgi:hypothetical protein
MPIKYVNEIPRNRRDSRFDKTIEEAMKMLDKDPTKLVEVSDEPIGFYARFKQFQADGMYEGVRVKRQGDTVYFSKID